MGKTKIIDGKKYQLYDIYKDEKKAKRRARWFRDGGVAARITEDKKARQWTVWFRRLSKTNY